MHTTISNSLLKYIEEIRNQNTPNKARILGNQKKQGGYAWVVPLNELIDKYIHLEVKIRDDWDNIKVRNYETSCLYKVYPTFTSCATTQRYRKLSYHRRFA